MQEAGEKVAGACACQKTETCESWWVWSQATETSRFLCAVGLIELPCTVRAADSRRPPAAVELPVRLRALLQRLSCLELLGPVLGCRCFTGFFLAGGCLSPRFGSARRAAITWVIGATSVKGAQCFERGRLSCHLSNRLPEWLKGVKTAGTYDGSGSERGSYRVENLNLQQHHQLRSGWTQDCGRTAACRPGKARSALPGPPHLLRRNESICVVQREDAIRNKQYRGGYG
jgi:hypothetical protein